jgi:protease I
VVNLDRSDEVIDLAKTVALVIAAKMFRDEEYQVPKAILEKAGVSVITVSTTLGEAQGKLGLTVKPDLILAELTVTQADVLLFIGGGGSSQYFDDPAAHRMGRLIWSKTALVIPGTRLKLTV